MTPSRILGGRYEVGELIGRGGMADVHIGHDTRLGRQVAIKMLRSDLARDTNFLQRFRREAQSAAGLNHPSIVAIFDSGEDESGIDPTTGARSIVPYMVMEYVEGQTLRQYLTARGQLDPRDAIRITEGILDALAYSHRMGIVHRDIKPANVMITPAGGVKVMDFGIARAIADTAATMTQTQSVVGTAQYLSPEQAQGQTVDARSDLYSTGCLLFELLTGRPPFMGDSPVAIAYQHVGELPQPPSIFNGAVAGDLDAVTLHALTKDREQRYQTADAFRADLENVRLGRQISAAALGTAAAIGAAATQTLPASYAAAGTPTAVQPPVGSPSQRYDNTAGLPPVGHDEDEDDGRRRSGARTALITIGVLALLGLIGWGAVVWFGDQAPKTVMVAVPSLQGKTTAEAVQLLANAKLQGQPSNAPSTDVPAGQVIDQDPAAGTQVAVSSTVKYRVSTGAETVSIPDVTNFPQDQARAELEKAGLVVSAFVPENTADRDKDRVTKTDPPANATVAKGSSVQIFFASGKVKVPEDLKGQDWVLAASSLKDQRLKAKKVTVPTADAAPDTVLEVAKAGEIVDFGTTIEVKVAAAPPPETTTITVTPSPTDSTPAPTGSTTPAGG